LTAFENQEEEEEEEEEGELGECKIKKRAGGE
jgi:hypothetical protein